jgi:hypothetical protein
MGEETGARPPSCLPIGSVVDQRHRGAGEKVAT